MEVIHTPTPWSAKEGTDGAWFIWNQNGGISTENLVASVIGRVNPDYRSGGIAAADAAHIVKCVNVHEQLLQCARWLEVALHHPGACEVWQSHRMRAQVIKAVQAAVAKAEGK